MLREVLDIVCIIQILYYMLLILSKITLKTTEIIHKSNLYIEEVHFQLGGNLYVV